MEKLTVKELQVLAKKKGLPHTGMTKAELILRIEMSEGLKLYKARVRARSPVKIRTATRRGKSLCGGKMCGSKICNPVSGRCVDKNGKIGQAVLWNTLARIPVKTSPTKRRSPLRRATSPEFRMDKATMERLEIAKELYKSAKVPVPRADNLVELLTSWRSRVFSKMFIHDLTVKFRKLKNKFRTFAVLIHGVFPDKSYEKFNPYSTTIAFMKMFKRGVLNRLVDKDLYDDIMKYCESRV